MHCVMCGRPMLKAAAMASKAGTVGPVGPKCAREAGLLHSTHRKAAPRARLTVPASRPADPRQMALELTPC